MSLIPVARFRQHTIRWSTSGRLGGPASCGAASAAEPCYRLELVRLVDLQRDGSRRRDDRDRCCRSWWRSDGRVVFHSRVLLGYLRRHEIRCHERQGAWDHCARLAHCCNGPAEGWLVRSDGCAGLRPHRDRFRSRHWLGGEQVLGAGCAEAAVRCIADIPLIISTAMGSSAVSSAGRRRGTPRTLSQTSARAWVLRTPRRRRGRRATTARRRR